MEKETGSSYGSLGMAVDWEVSRLLQEAQGDRAKATELALTMCLDRELITQAELENLQRIRRLRSEVADGQRSAESAYIEAQRTHYEIVRSANPSPAAMTLASLQAQSYLEIDEGYGDEPTVVFKESRTSWAEDLAVAGVLLGSIIPGVGTTTLGTGGYLLGRIVDRCTEDDDEGGENGDEGGENGEDGAEDDDGDGGGPA